MAEKRSAPAAGGTATGARAESTGTGAVSSSDFTTAGATRQPLRVSDFLARGRENARNHKYLQQMTGLKNRELRLAIQAERRHVPILSDCVKGYYLPESVEEINAFARSMRHRGGEINRIAGIVQLVGADWLEAADNDS